MGEFYKDKIVWITGATSGVGLALAKELIHQSAKVIVSGTKESKLEEAFKDLKSDNLKFLAFQLQDFNAKEVVNKAWSLFGGVDILFNNAGISQHSSVEDTSFELDRLFLEVNYFGNIALTKELLPKFRENKRGQVVVTSSVIGDFGQPLLASYAASKHAINGWYESLQYELADSPIKITLLTLGFIKTDIDKKSILGNGKIFEEKSQAQLNGLDTKECALKILKATSKGKRKAYIGKMELLMPLVKRFSPSLFFMIMKKLNQDKLNKYYRD
jgi:short-subunit dehydrogenase